MSTYQYIPLDLTQRVFRLVRLFPVAQATDVPRCKINLAKLDQRERRYDALSYVWGDPNVTRDVKIVLPDDTEKTFRVTENLFAALVALRHQNKSRVLWIDAICIDQANLDERSHQVQRMLDIYQQARGVVVWLGLEPTAATESLTGAVDKCISNKHSNLPKQYVKSFAQFLEADWFYRIWVSVGIAS